MFLLILLFSPFCLMSMDMNSRFSNTVTTYSIQEELRKLNLQALAASKNYMDSQNPETKKQCNEQLTIIGTKFTALEQKLGQHKDGVYYDKAHDLLQLGRNVLKQHDDNNIADLLCSLQQRFNNFPHEVRRRP